MMRKAIVITFYVFALAAALGFIVFCMRPPEFR